MRAEGRRLQFDPFREGRSGLGSHRNRTEARPSVGEGTEQAVEQRVEPDVFHRLDGEVAGVVVVFGRHQVCRRGGDFFVRNWQDLLSPSRDDAVILPEDRGVVLFYCHEDEFEFGRRLNA